MSERSAAGIRVLTSPPWRAARRNPYNQLLYSHLSDLGALVDDHTTRRAVSGSYDVWHLHWPEDVLKGHRRRALVRAARLVAALTAARARGTKIVWTIHNLAPHEHGDPRVARAFWAAFLRRVDAAISLTGAGARAAVERFPRLSTVPLSVVPHGHYQGSYPSPPTRADARAILGLPPDATTYLFFGQIRPYKNVGAVLRAFTQTADPHARLVIAGEPRSAELGRAVTESATVDTRIVPWLGVVPAEDVPVLFAAADVVVLPFSEGFNSGSAMLALSLGRPVLLPWTPTFSELQDQVGEPWVQLYDRDLTVDVLADSAATAPSDAGGPDLSAFAWDRVAAETIGVYRAVLR